MRDHPPTNQQPTLTACHECDLLLDFTPAKKHHAYHCPRCNFRIHEHKPNSINNTLALAVTGLILFIPATQLPTISMTLFGTLIHDTLLTGIFRLHETGHIAVSILVMLCSIIFPLLRLLTACFVLIAIKLQRAGSIHIIFFKLFHHLGSWSMLEVYLVGIMVAAIKMMDIAAVYPGPGLLCFIGLMLSSIGLSRALDKHQIWELLDKQSHG